MQYQQHDWELCKENIRPLRKGRRMENLLSALVPQCDQEKYRAEAVKQKRVFENAIRTYSGDDPLQPWCAYIVWTEQNYPKGGKEGCLLELLQKCFNKFENEADYQNDSRFVQISLDLADMLPDPLELYQYMYGKGIGSKLAAFYCKWAMVLENLGDNKRADEIFNEGEKRNAEPVEDLTTSHKMFIARLFSKDHEMPEPKNATSPIQEQRVALGGLRGAGSQNRVGPTRTGAAKLNCQKGLPELAVKPLQVQSKVTVFCDENAPPSTLPMKVPSAKGTLSTGASARKENEEKPGKWSSAKASQKGYCLGSSECKFIVYVDSEAVQSTPQPPQTPSSTALCARKLDQPIFLNKAQSSVQKTDCQQRLMYCKEKLLNGTVEFQFEELRALRWRQKQRELEEQRLKEREESLQRREVALQNEIKQLKMVKEVVMGVTPDVLQEFIKCFHRDSANCPITVPTMKVSTTKLDCCAAAPQETCGTQSASGYLASNLLEQPYGAENGLLKPTTPETCHAVGSGNSSASNSLTKTFGTPHSQTMNCVRALWNGQNLVSEVNSVENPNQPNIPPRVPFVVFVDGDVEKDVSNAALSTPRCISKLEQVKNVDSLQSNTQTSVPNSVNDVQNDKVTVEEGKQRSPDKCSEMDSSDEENLQNIPPKDYTMAKSQRCLAGILVPSLNIPYTSAVEQEELMDMDGANCDMNGIEPLDGYVRNEFSITCPSTTIFMSNLKIASTPVRMRTLVTMQSNDVFNDQKSSFPANQLPLESNSKIPMTSKPELIATQPEGSKADSLVCPATNKPVVLVTPCKGLVFHRISGRPADLSAISENSREYKSSSSSGTSSNATSHFKTYTSRRKFSVEALTITEKQENHESPGGSNHQVASTVAPSLESPAEMQAIDPFDGEVRTSILNQLQCPLREREHYLKFDYNMPQVKEATNLLLGNDKYLITRLCATGGYAKVYTGLDMTSELSSTAKAKRKHAVFALKIQKPSCPWEFYISSELCFRVTKLQNVSAETMTYFMNITKFYDFKNGSICVTDYCPYGTLLDLINLYTKRMSTLPEVIVLYFTIEILSIIKQVHACKIIHADVKPDNFLLVTVPNITAYSTSFDDIFGDGPRSLRLVDYGRSIDMLAFPSGTTFTTPVKTSKFECNEMKDESPWTYQLWHEEMSKLFLSTSSVPSTIAEAAMKPYPKSDFYGVAGCSHVMLFGTYMSTVKQNEKWQITTTLKRYWQREEWANFFDTLLNIPSCDSLPDTEVLLRSLGNCLIRKRHELPGHLRQLSDMLPSMSHL